MRDLKPVIATAPMKSPEIDLDFTPVASLMHDEAEADRFGGVALVVKGERVLLEQAVGHALRWAKLPINRDTRFALASASKLFTVVAIGQLIELGLVSLEDPVTKFLPEHAHRTGWSEVTLGHLLSHTSGFGSYWGPDLDARRTALVTVQAHFQPFEQTPLAFAPGTRFDYSNVGFILLGAVIERVTGQDSLPMSNSMFSTRQACGTLDLSRPMPTPRIWLWATPTVVWMMTLHAAQPVPIRI